MSDAQFKLLNLKAAWARVKADLSERVFVQHPFELQLIELDLDRWLQAIAGSIKNDSYVPGPMLVCDIPKGKGAIRAGGHVSIADRVAYAACVAASLPYIRKTLSWAEAVDFSYQLSPNPRYDLWFGNRFSGWNHFREESLARIPQFSSIVVTDISGFYDNIDIATLASDIRQSGVPEPVCQLLSACLNKWSQVPGRGIPQGQSASDILAKLYLNSVDQNLRSKGITHLRYVDDIRIFCRTSHAAKTSLLELTKLLRRRGLALQSAKSDILDAAAAKTKIEGVIPILKDVRSKYLQKILAAVAGSNPYMNMAEAEALLAKDLDDAPLEVLKDAFAEYFEKAPPKPFDKTLFHFMLSRFAKLKDQHAIAHCITLLGPHPEETGDIVKYASSVIAMEAIQDKIVEFITSDEAVYSYQVYLLVRGLSLECRNPSPKLLGLVRKLAFDKSQPAYLRSVSRKSLSDWGTPADLELLEQAYPEANSDLERAEIICGLRRMEKGRRNAFLARVEKESDLNSRACTLLRS